jgi:hypothetical protein
METFFVASLFVNNFPSLLHRTLADMARIQPLNLPNNPFEPQRPSSCMKSTPASSKGPPLLQRNECLEGRRQRAYDKYEFVLSERLSVQRFIHKCFIFNRIRVWWTGKGDIAFIFNLLYPFRRFKSREVW